MVISPIVVVLLVASSFKTKGNEDLNSKAPSGLFRGTRRVTQLKTISEKSLLLV
jgi:hypothetical protein